MLILIRESLFYRGHSSRRFAHFYEKRHFFFWQKGHFSTQNNDRGVISLRRKMTAGVIILYTGLRFFLFNFKIFNLSIVLLNSLNTHAQTYPNRSVPRTFTKLVYPFHRQNCSDLKNCGCQLYVMLLAKYFLLWKQYTCMQIKNIFCWYGVLVHHDLYVQMHKLFEQSSVYRQFWKLRCCINMNADGFYQ